MVVELIHRLEALAGRAQQHAARRDGEAEAGEGGLERVEVVGDDADMVDSRGLGRRHWFSPRRIARVAASSMAPVAGSMTTP